MEDGDLYTVSYYLQHGHTLQEMVNLSPVEMCFYRQAMTIELEKQSKMFGGE